MYMGSNDTHDNGYAMDDSWHDPHGWWIYFGMVMQKMWVINVLLQHDHEFGETQLPN